MCSPLPPALLDLTLLRLATPSSVRPALSVASNSRWSRALGRRSGHHAAALEPIPSPAYQEFINNELATYKLAERRKYANANSLTVRNSMAGQTKVPMHPVRELEKRVQALDEAIESEQLAFQPSFYTEENLMALYQDVLAVDIPENARSNDKEAKRAVEKALAAAEADEDTRILKKLQQRVAQNESGDPDRDSEISHRNILLRVHDIVSRAEAARVRADPSSAGRPPSIPIAVLSTREFETLVRKSVAAHDTAAGEIALDIAKIAGLPMPMTALDNILRQHAVSGDSTAADKLLKSFLIEKPTEMQRHLHVQAHLNATPQEVLPTSALNLLHYYEEQNAAVPMRTYTSVITSLFSRPSSLARAHAWDLFSHMRYVAHPNPDVLLYTLMIRACASPVSVAYSSEPEKALDLWTEMTADHSIEPTVGSYNAVILACAKSGEKTYVNEAFRLCRQMLDSHRDAGGYSAFRPDRKTFCALLEGTKRIGDLARARWILAEMVRGSGKEEVNPIDAEIDDEVMMHMFHTYASYKPPFIRSTAPLVTGDSATDPTVLNSQSNPTSVTTQPSEGPETGLAVEDKTDAPTFAHNPPQTHAEVVREVKVLFDRILRDNRGEESQTSASLPFSEKKFRNVKLSPRLLGSYLSVFYQHALLETAQELFRKIFDELQVMKTPRLIVDALERCANGRRGAERQVALAFSNEVWDQWIALEKIGCDPNNALNSRFVERAHVARIRILAVTDNINRAMDQLRDFAARYPPNNVTTPSPKHPLQSTRTALVGQRPLVRMTSVTEVPDDHVPPLMTFRDVEVLHHRLIGEGRTKDIGYITWLCKAYEWALRVRRDQAVKAKVSKKVVATAA
ncbi:hypothetical protein CPB84DRAFT_1778412 [Gymnopilus junonius]|uniref:Uncharacterized protein n=1 Tax=Gymnopilus junonius TaxID=109634 RepID=A0A9P5TMB3_GYMJU|nr:hypothetical protein CPB84DRAFT_1778412 [Gymnopilus junonius]